MNINLNEVHKKETILNLESLKEENNKQEKEVLQKLMLII